MPVISSLLDTDFYKLTMQQAVLRRFPDATAEYAFTCRSACGRRSSSAFDQGVYRADNPLVWRWNVILLLFRLLLRGLPDNLSA